MKLVVMGNGMVGHKLRKELMAARHADRGLLCIGECIEMLGHSAQWGDGVQVPAR
jgi:NAD(P)H-nitrite reductase large subunit